MNNMEGTMKKMRIINRPTKVDSLDFDDLSGEINPNWEHKAEALQIRKRRAFKNLLRGSTH